MSDDIEVLRNERDSIFRKMEASTNASERKSLRWAWHIKQVQLMLCFDKNSSLAKGINPHSK